MRLWKAKQLSDGLILILSSNGLSKQNINWVFSPEKRLFKEFTSCSPFLQLFGELGSSEDSPAQSSAALSVETYFGFLSNLTLMNQMIQVKDSIYLEKGCCFFKAIHQDN